MEKAADLVREIAEQSNEQAAGIQILNSGIAQVSSVVQNNAATSEETAAASEQLIAQASTLKDAVSVFKLNNGCGVIQESIPQIGGKGQSLDSSPAELSIVPGGDDFGKY